MRYVIPLLLIFFITHSFGQDKSIISGRVNDIYGKPISKASIRFLDKNKGIATDDSGYFKIITPSEKAFALVFSHTGFNEEQKNFFQKINDSVYITVTLTRNGNILSEVVISDDRERKENGLIKIDPKQTQNLPSATGGIEAMIKTLVGSNNELSSQYNVRGGNFDENLIYLNDIELFRPYLVRSGQQEGLSFINPELVKNVQFYTGGFQAKYGDKMSSVLDIQYKKPIKKEGSVYAGFLEQGFAYASPLKNKGSIIVGLRSRNNRSILSKQPTSGSYIPSASDAQTYLTLPIKNKWQVELLGIHSTSAFTYYPESLQQTASVFSPLYSSNLGLDTYFEGQEKDKYQSNLISGTIIHTPNNKLKLKWIFSYLQNKETEKYDITGSYLFGERDFDPSSSTFGSITNPLGAGMYQQFARNKLNMNVWTLSHRGSLERKKHVWLWGNNVEQVIIDDYTREFEYRDSAGYSLPYHPNSASVFYSNYSKNQLKIVRFSGFIQDNIRKNIGNSVFTLQSGLRYNYNTLNDEFIFTPRFQSSWQPGWKKDVVFKASIGMYHQPVFYRELKSSGGQLTTDLQAQKSVQIAGGMDYQFANANGKPFRLSTEYYYKYMWDVIAYDIDNVKIRYLGNNHTKAYATGIEMRLFGELIKDAESWLSIGFMRTREDLDNDHYYEYLNANGEIINANTPNKVIKDSVRREVGYVRRPTDRLFTMGVFLQDYLATNKNFRVHLSLLYGSNLPYNIPGSARYRNGLIINPYIRADIGFSALLLNEKNERRARSPFRNVKSIWMSVEIFNIINRANTISYQLIKDYSNNTYAIPNRLTPRMLNIKLLTRF